MSSDRIKVTELNEATSDNLRELSDIYIVGKDENGDNKSYKIDILSEGSPFVEFIKSLTREISSENNVKTTNIDQQISGHKDFYYYPKYIGVSDVPVDNSFITLDFIKQNLFRFDGIIDSVYELINSYFNNNDLTFDSVIRYSDSVRIEDDDRLALVTKEYVDRLFNSGDLLRYNRDKTITALFEFNRPPTISDSATITSANQLVNKKYVDDILSGNLDDIVTGFVDLIHDQTIGGIKTFTNSPRVPTPSDDNLYNVVNVDYLNNRFTDLLGYDQLSDVVLVGNPEDSLSQTITGNKIFSAPVKATYIISDSTEGNVLTTKTYVDNKVATSITSRLTNYVTTNTDQTNISGNKTCTGTWTFTNTIMGTANRAKWADLAEMYLMDKVYPIGTLVRFGGINEMTINDGYDVNAVISDKPAYLMNDELSSNELSQPIALVGRVKVRVRGKVDKFDYITPDLDNPGIAIASTYVHRDERIGRALESKDSYEEGLVLCSVKLSI